MPKTDLNDLLDVVAVGAAVVTAVAEKYPFIDVKTVFPSEWKGNMPKRAMLERIQSKLSKTDESNVAWTNKSDNEDILDAIGIGLWHFGRLNTKLFPGAT